MKRSHIKLTGFWLLLLALSIGSFPEIAAAESPASTTKPVIRNITVLVRDIFDQDETDWFYRNANKLKLSTRESVVRDELFFKEGDEFNQFLIDESERALRSLGYLRRVEIVPTQDGDFVDILVRVQDTWTLIPQVSYSSGDGTTQQSLGLADNNLLGYGKRLELLWEEDENRTTIEGVYDSRRVFGTRNRFLLAGFDRDDGQRGVFFFGRPFTSLVEKQAWFFNSDISDTVGRLFVNSDERYIFRHELMDISARYTISRGNPEESLDRYSFGYAYDSATFTQADAQDYSDLSLDPARVSNDLSMLADDRRYSGPVFAWHHIDQDIIPMNYIDRFSRVEDYNLGTEYSLSAHLAPEALGSIEDALLLSGNRSAGVRFDTTSFIRGEVGFATRLIDEGIENSLIRGEIKYYNVSDQPLKLFGQTYGPQTFAAAFFIDYGDDLDKDREFLIGGDNALRGYKARTFSGDKRMALNIEQRFHFVEDVLNLLDIGAAVFAEAGGASSESLGHLISDHIYSDVGVGLRFGFPRSTGERVFRIDLAWPLRDGPDGSGEFEPRVLFSGGMLFGANLRSEALGPEKASVSVGFDR